MKQQAMKTLLLFSPHEQQQVMKALLFLLLVLT